MSTIARRHPFLAANDFASIFDALVGDARAPRVATPAMPIDVIEKPDALVVEAELPGFTKDDVTVEFHDGVLAISATRTKIESHEEPASADSCCGQGCAGEKKAASRVIVRERSTANVRRMLAMPERVTGEGIVAEMQDGILRVTLPFATKPSPRRISVN